MWIIVKGSAVHARIELTVVVEKLIDGRLDDLHRQHGLSHTQVHLKQRLGVTKV